MTVLTSNSQIVFACHSAACRPPTSGGTGGSSGKGGGGRRGRGSAAADDSTPDGRGIPGQPFSRGVREFTTARKIPAGGEQVRNLGDKLGSVTIERQAHRSKEGQYFVRQTDMFTPGGKYLEERGAHGRFKTHAEAVDFANKAVAHRLTYDERKKGEGVAKAAARATTAKDRAATIKANPNAPIKLNRGEVKALEEAYYRQWGAYQKANGSTKGFKFNPDKTRLPSHVKATAKALQEHSSGTKGRGGKVTELIPTTPSGKYISGIGNVI